MPDGDMDVPEENREYRVILGRSLFTATGEAHDGAAHDGDQGDAAYALFQYKFTPASVDAAIPGLVSMDDSTGVTVLRGTTAKSTDGGISFKGKIAEQKEIECLLIFDGVSFRLERCEYVLSQLRHVRAAPLQRPPPSAYPAPMGKKSLLLGAAKRTGKPGRPTTKGTKKCAAKSANDDMPRAPEPSTGVSTNSSSASTSVASVRDDGDRNATDLPSNKRQRKEE